MRVNKSKPARGGSVDVFIGCDLDSHKGRVVLLTSFSCDRALGLPGEADMCHRLKCGYSDYESSLRISALHAYHKFRSLVYAESFAVLLISFPVICIRLQVGGTPLPVDAFFT